MATDFLQAILGGFFGFSLGTIFHEFGHVLCARAASLQVARCVIGHGPRLLHWRQGGTDFEIHLWPNGGATQVYGDLRWKRYAEIALALGGVLGNLAAIGTIIALGAYCHLPAGTGLVAVLVQLFTVVISLYPHRGRMRGGEFDSDGLRLWKVFRHWNDAFSPYGGSIYLAGLRRYDPSTEDTAIDSPLAPVLFRWQAYVGRTADPVTRHRVERTLDDLLRNPAASKAERLMALDMLITDGLLAQPRSATEALLAWSAQALALDGTNETVLESRAAVLIEAGQHQEGKAILERLSPAQGDFAAALRRIFLARAEHGLGNGAAEAAAEVKTMAGAGHLGADVVARLRRLFR